MTQRTTHIGRIARRATIVTVPLLVAASGTAVAHGGGSYGGGMMGNWGTFGGTMGLWGLLWMGLLLAVPLYLVVALTRDRRADPDERSLSVLRERYARGELSDEEYERRRTLLEAVD